MDGRTLEGESLGLVAAVAGFAETPMTRVEDAVPDDDHVFCGGRQ